MYAIATDIISFSIPVGEDYLMFPSVNLTFSSSLRRINHNVTILDDNITEPTENFSGKLTIVTMRSNAPNVQLNPQIAQFSILDDVDSK